MWKDKFKEVFLTQSFKFMVGINIFYDFRLLV